MCVTALEAFGRILHDRDRSKGVVQPNGTVLSRKQKDQIIVASFNPPGLELINVDCETRIRRTGIPTRRSDFFDFFFTITAMTNTAKSLSGPEHVPAAL